MRKIFKNMAWTMAATLVMAACSDSLDESSGNGNEFNTDGTGYVKIALNLPSTSGTSTRADSENDDFNDGLAAEYKVNNVILALFYGADESSATCQWAKDLGSLNFHNNTSNNITTYSDFVVNEVPKPTNNVYALAIVNGNNYFSVNAANNLVYNTAQFTGKYTDLFGIGSSVEVDLTKIAGTGGFMMTNAPISKQGSVESTGVASWSPDITTLVKLDIYEDEPSAEGATPNPIYVERVVAKVSVKINSNNGVLTVPDDKTYAGATVEFKNWTLQNTNKSTYLVRNVVGTEETPAWKTWTGSTYFNANATNRYNRFVGTTATPYRTYWGIDPNYESVADDNLATNFNIWSSNSEPSTDDWSKPTNNTTASDAVEVAYCGENTSKAAAMKDNQLTSVLLKATFTPSGATSGQNFFTCNDVSTIYTEDQIGQAFAVVLSEATGNLALQAGEKITVKTSATEGKTIDDQSELVKVFEITTDGASGKKELSSEQAAAILAKYPIIKFYKDGVTYYYTTAIKHFGDVYTPANQTNPETYTDQNHLGRYGVLRNNWYELQINSVSGPGEPEIPVLPEEPVDKEHRYINCEINILSWAKRSQGVDL